MIYKKCSKCDSNFNLIELSKVRTNKTIVCKKCHTSYFVSVPVWYGYTLPLSAIVAYFFTNWILYLPIQDFKKFLGIIIFYIVWVGCVGYLSNKFMKLVPTK